MPTDPLPTTRLDVTGQKCPLPVLKARKALAGLAPGAILEVLATDPGAAEDFEALCKAGGHRLVGQETVGETQRFLIEKGCDAIAGGPADGSA